MPTITRIRPVTRVRLAGRHDSRTLGIRYADMGGMIVKAYVTYSTDEDSADAGGISEVFIVASKPGSAAEAALRDAGIVLSLALQHGATLADIARSLTRNEDGTPGGPVGVVVDAVLADVAARRVPPDGPAAAADAMVTGA